MGARKAKAEASHEARKKAFNDQARGPAGASAGSPPPNGQNAGEPSALGKPQQIPSRPRILGLQKKTNLVGVHQQEYHVVRGEKYGLYTVVNDNFFDTGPTVRT